VNPAGQAIVDILLWGLIGTLSMASVMSVSQNLGLSRLNMPFLLGTLFTGDRHVAYVLGFLIYGFGGWFFAFFYYLLFAELGRASWWLGGIVGVIHGLLLLTAVLPLLPHVHPRVASEYDGAVGRRRLEPPGFLALHYGYRTPLVTLLAHAVYGAVLGAGFHTGLL
jgi:hypothetical protein